MIEDATVQPVSLPAGAVALSAEASTVIAAKGASWIRSTPETTPTARRIPVPKGSSGAPARVEGIGANYLLAVWRARGGRQPIALVDAVAGKLLMQTRLTPGIDITDATVIRQIGGEMTAIGELIVDPETQSMQILKAGDRVESLTSGHAVIARGRGLVDVALPPASQFALTPYSAKATSPLMATIVRPDKRQQALLVTTTSGGPVLVGLPPAVKRKTPA